MPLQFPSSEIPAPPTYHPPVLSNNIITTNYYYSIQQKRIPLTSLPSVQSMPQLQSRTPIYSRQNAIVTPHHYHPYYSNAPAPALKKSCKGCGTFFTREK
jgi:hypothetical protein